MTEAVETIRKEREQLYSIIDSLQGIRNNIEQAMKQEGADAWTVQYINKLENATIDITKLKVEIKQIINRI